MALSGSSPHAALPFGASPAQEEPAPPPPDTPSRHYFAWVNGPVEFSEDLHLKEDLKILACTRILAENDFPSMSLRIPRPVGELLTPSQKRWAWVSYRKLDGTIKRLLLGWLVGLPEEMDEYTVTIVLTSRPPDFFEQKVAVANTLKTLPQYDPAFVKPEMREDPDIILEARPVAWHTSHLYPLTVTTSHLVTGEEGHLTFESGTSVPFDSVSRSFRNVPLRRVNVTAEVHWLQSASGKVDLKIPLLKAAREAGTTAKGVVTTYTGQGLADDWPKEDDRIGSGWAVSEASVAFVSQEPKEVTLDELPITWEFKGSALDPILSFLRGLSTVPGNAIFYLWHLVPTFIAKYEVSRRRSEILTFTLEADVQPIFTEAGDEEALDISASALDLNEPIDAGESMPIRDLRRRSYFNTDRGRQSVEYLMSIASAHLIARGRCVEVEFTVPYEEGLEATCKRNATLVDPRFPGGATGKIVGAVLMADADRGEFSCTITIACSVGEGNIVVADPGVALYIDDAYIDEDYFVRTGSEFLTSEGRLTYGDFSNVPPNDDGVDFFDMNYHNVVESVELVNGQTAQTAVLDLRYPDIPQAVDALEEAFSEYRLVLVPLEGEFTTEYTITNSLLMLDKTIDLRASG